MNVLQHKHTPNAPPASLPTTAPPPPPENPPPPMAKVKASIDIDSEPSGAVVILNGNKIGVTPKRIPNLEVGVKVHLELRHAGFKPLNEDLDVHGDEHFTRRLAKLGARPPHEPEPVVEVKGVGFMVVNSPGNPDTKVIVDGRDTKRATPVSPSDPLKLAPGTHAVMLIFKDGTKKSFQVSIAMGETYKLIEPK
jgi:hypothetical protein